jgi:4-diphosphocytidyl-2-C-methyl-D-erythritol kinase
MLRFPHAKINLGLRIVAKRPDGFHDLETCFYPVPELCDGLEMLEAAESDLTIHGESWAESRESNLVWKAMDLFRSFEPNLPPLNWHLLKRIPSGAGLGGGSSDAAFALRMMAAFSGWHEQDERLFEMAAKLGSDCSFFIQDKSMLGFGRGEILKPAEINLDAFDIRFIFPGIHISTAKAFSGISVTRPEKSIEEVLSLPVEEWRNHLKNDFEESLFPVFPELQQAKEKLYSEGAVYASMSGSGSALFGLFKKNP